jgi:hypothetical protein
VLKNVCGRLAQVDRALASGTKGRAFESRIARHIIIVNMTIAVARTCRGAIHRAHEDTGINY